jgi:hypothetical protein
VIALPVSFWLARGDGPSARLTTMIVSAMRVLFGIAWLANWRG